VLAAATRVNLRNGPQARRDVGRRQNWQEVATQMFDAVPEVKHGVWFRGNSLSKLRLFAATLPPGAKMPVPVDAEGSGVDPALAARAIAELARLDSADGGVAGIIREASMNVDLTGECFLVGWGPRDAVVDPTTGRVTAAATPEMWELRSVREIETTSDDAKVVLVKDAPGDPGRPLDPDRDTIIRVYQRHPIWSSLADCNMSALLGDCEALVSLHHQSLAESRARHNAGLLCVPNELNFGRPDSPGEDDDREDDDEADPLTEGLHEFFAEAVDASSEPAAWSPGILRGPAAALKADVLRWMDVGRPATDLLDAKITARVERVARGLNLPVETTMGHQQTTFANADQVDEDLWDDYLEPSAVTLVDAFTTGFLRPNLLDTGNDETPPVPEMISAVANIFVWYDESELVKPPDPAKEADAAHAAGAISDAAYRTYKGFGDEDAPTPEERLARIGATRGALSPEVTVALLELMGQAITVRAGSAGTAAANQDNTTMAAVVASSLAGATTERRAQVFELLSVHPTLCTEMFQRVAAVTASASETPPAPRPAPAPTDTGRQLLEIDRELRTRLLVLADATLTRALERAGNRLRGQAQFRHQLRNVPPPAAAATLGASVVASAFTDDELLAEAFAPMRDQFMSWGARAQADAIDLVGRVVGGFDTAARDALKLRQAADLNEAWSWLEDTLVALAKGRLFDPSFGLEDVGEVAEGLSVPPGMIREAMARAGGAAGIETLGTDAWVTVGEAGTRPIGGIALGDLVRGVLRDGGASIEGYRWVYGPASRRRPFEPHQRLSGVTFENFDADVLANSSGWPPFGYYMPGDHKGCMCDVEPVIIGPNGDVVADY